MTSTTAGAFSSGFPQKTKKPELSPLREDIKLIRAPDTGEGAPSWMINDPVRHQFYKIGWKEFEILKYWHYGDIEKIVKTVNRATTLEISPVDVEQVLLFLMENRLIQQPSGPFIQRFRSGRLPLRFFLTAHLYQQFGLISPDRFLGATLPFVNFWFKKKFWAVMAAIAILSVYLTIRQWESFQYTFLYFFTLQGLIIFIGATAFVKIGHEFAHAFAAKRYGLHVPMMGVAFIVFWPILFTDTTDAWKLQDKKQRLVIGLSGVAFEIAIAIMATLAWHLVPVGPVKSAMFLLATTTWIVSLSINLNPFMRFDGYYLLSDYLDIPNLRPRSFALAKWFIRKIILGYNAPSPENLNLRTQVFMLLYAFSSWIYRLVLYTGIALIVYHLFFKVLGLVFFIAQISILIGLPIFKEMRQWIRLRREARITFYNILFIMFLLSGLLLLFLSTDKTICIPALLQAENYSNIYAGQSGRIEKIYIQHGQKIHKGDRIFTLTSPDIDFEKKKDILEIEKLKSHLKQLGFIKSQSDQLKIVQHQLIEAMTRLDGIKKKEKNLEITSTIDGTVVYLAEALRPGLWVNESHKLAMIVDTGKLIIEGWVDEPGRVRIQDKMKGIFYPADTEEKNINVYISDIETSHTDFLETPYMASESGGKLAVRIDQQGNLALQQTCYRVIFLPENLKTATQKIMRGTVQVKCKPVSPVLGLFKQVTALLLRESGF